MNHYNRTFVTGLIAILELLIFGWIYNYKQASEKVPLKSLYVYGIGFWCLITINPFIAVFAYGDYRLIFLCIFVVLYPVLLIVSYLFAGDIKFSVWFKLIIFSNVNKLCDHILRLARQGKDPDRKRWWEPIFRIYFCLMVKYLSPLLFSYALLYYFEDDITTRYKGSYLRSGSYPLGTTMIGWTIVIINLFIICVPAMFVTNRETLGFNVDKPFTKEVTNQQLTGRRIEPQRDLSEIGMGSNAARDASRITVMSGRDRVSTEQNLYK